MTRLATNRETPSANESRSTDAASATGDLQQLDSPAYATLLGDIAAGASRRDAQRIAPHEEVRRIAQAGLGRLRLPIAEGGAGITVRRLFQFLIDLAEADSNVAHILRAHYWFVEAQLQRPVSDPLRARHLALVNQGHIFGNAFSEQSARPVGLYFDTKLTPDPTGQGYRLNGKKFYSTGSLFSTYTVVMASTPAHTVAAITLPVERAGLTLEDDWDGFGQRLTGTGSTVLDNVAVAEDEVEDYGNPDAPQPPSYQFAFLQLYLQGLAAGILRSVRKDAAALVARRRRNFSHAQTETPAQDPQLLQVVGEIAADAFAAEAIVLAAAAAIDEAAATVRDGLPERAAAERAQLAAAQAKVAVDRFAHATATRLFDAGGASATQSVYNLDRHWRNLRTASTHNPTFAKATAVGDFFVNGTPPPLNAFF